jgi:hypothetical protein
VSWCSSPSQRNISAPDRMVATGLAHLGANAVAVDGDNLVTHDFSAR